MLKPFITIVSFSLFSHAVAQPFSQVSDQSNPFMNDGNGRPLYIETRNKAEGSLYFLDSYNKVTIVLADGRVAKSISIKLDLMNNRIQYINEVGVEMISAVPIKKFTFTSPLLSEKNKSGSISKW